RRYSTRSDSRAPAFSAYVIRPLGAGMLPPRVARMCRIASRVPSEKASLSDGTGRRCIVFLLRRRLARHRARLRSSRTHSSSGAWPALLLLRLDRTWLTYATVDAARQGDALSKVDDLPCRAERCRFRQKRRDVRFHFRRID